MSATRTIALSYLKKRSKATMQAILALPAFKSVSQEKAYVFPLVPGKGVHIPSKGPHWVKNGDDYSVSFSINFCLREMDLKSRVYQCNHYLRRLNFTPTAPGSSEAKDWLKIMALARLRKSKAANKYELLRTNIKRLDRASRVIGKVFRRPNYFGQEAEHKIGQTESPE